MHAVGALPGDPPRPLGVGLQAQQRLAEGVRVRRPLQVVDLRRQHPVVLGRVGRDQQRAAADRVGRGLGREAVGHPLEAAGRPRRFGRDRGEEDVGPAVQVAQRGRREPAVEGRQLGRKLAAPLLVRPDQVQVEALGVEPGEGREGDVEALAGRGVGGEQAGQRPRPLPALLALRVEAGFGQRLRHVGDLGDVLQHLLHVGEGAVEAPGQLARVLDPFRRDREAAAGEDRAVEADPGFAAELGDVEPFHRVCPDAAVGPHPGQALEEEREDRVDVGDAAAQRPRRELGQRVDRRREGVVDLPHREKERVRRQLVQGERLVVAEAAAFPGEGAVEVGEAAAVAPAPARPASRGEPPRHRARRLQLRPGLVGVGVDRVGGVEAREQLVLVLGPDLQRPPQPSSPLRTLSTAKSLAPPCGQR